MGSLRRRVGRLEDDRGGPCPACGIGANSEIEYVVDFDKPSEAGERSDENPAELELEPCSVCGERSTIVVDWDDAPTEDELERLEEISESEPRRKIDSFAREPSVEGVGVDGY